MNNQKKYTRKKYIHVTRFLTYTACMILLSSYFVYPEKKPGPTEQEVMADLLTGVDSYAASLDHISEKYPTEYAYQLMGIINNLHCNDASRMKFCAELGKLLYTGREGMHIDKKEACRLFAIAADAEDFSAFFYLAQVYMDNNAVKKDLTKARLYINKLEKSMEHFSEVRFLIHKLYQENPSYILATPYNERRFFTDQELSILTINAKINN